MDYLKLIRDKGKYILLGLILLFLSFPGQSLFLGLFADEIKHEFGWSGTEYGSIYSVTSIITAFLLIGFGALIDKFRLKNVAVLNGVVFCLALVAALFISGLQPFHFIIVFFFIRLCAQGFSQLSYTSINRYFSSNRGKATALSSLGLPIAEILVPFVIGLILGQYSWQYIFAFTGVITLVLVLLSSKKIIKNSDIFHSVNEQVDNTQKQFTSLETLKDYRIYFYIPLALVIPFFMTGFFIHQQQMGDSLLWESWWLTSGLSAYGLARFIIPFFTGILIDKYSAKKVFMLHLIPIIIGFTCILFIHKTWAVLTFFFLTGISVGIGAIGFNALFAELYGIKHLGSINGIFKTLVVLSSALGPLVLGLFLDGSSNISTLMQVPLYSFCAAMLLGFLSDIIFEDKSKTITVTSQIEK